MSELFRPASLLAVFIVLPIKVMNPFIGVYGVSMRVA